MGENCKYAHNFEEISYHPARYKTRICKRESGCKGLEICSYAHDELDIRLQISYLYKDPFKIAKFNEAKNKFSSAYKTF